MLFRKKREYKKCFWRKLSIIVVLLSAVLSLSLKSIDVYAANLYTSTLKLNYRTNNSQSYTWANDLLYGRSYGVSIVYGAARAYQINTAQVTPDGSSAVLHFETNIVISTDDISTIFGYWSNLGYLDILGVSFPNSSLSIRAKSLSTAITDWTEVVNGTTYYNSTLTVYGDVAVDGVAQNTGRFGIQIGNLDYAFYTNNTDNPDLVYFEQNPMNIEWSSNINDLLLQTQINQNNTIINQNNEYYSKEYEADSNISNQSTSDINGATNSQTNSIIGTISSFVSAIGNIQTGSCELTLPFPVFAGGSQTVNPCSGKEKAPTIVAIGSSMLLIGIFIPFAFIVLKMIYSEIRGWTNG